jgi:hypothetical protein
MCMQIVCITGVRWVAPEFPCKFLNTAASIVKNDSKFTVGYYLILVVVIPQQPPPP